LKVITFHAYRATKSSLRGPGAFLEAELGAEKSGSSSSSSSSGLPFLGRRKGITCSSSISNRGSGVLGVSSSKSVHIPGRQRKGRKKKKREDGGWELSSVAGPEGSLSGALAWGGVKGGVRRGVGCKEIGKESRKSAHSGSSSSSSSSSSGGSLGGGMWQVCANV